MKMPYVSTLQTKTEPHLKPLFDLSHLRRIGLPYFQHPKRGQVLPASKTKVELLHLMMFYISLVVAGIVMQGHNKDEFIGVC